MNAFTLALVHSVRQLVVAENIRAKGARLSRAYRTPEGEDKSPRPLPQCDCSSLGLPQGDGSETDSPLGDALAASGTYDAQKTEQDQSGSMAPGHFLDADTSPTGTDGASRASPT